MQLSMSAIEAREPTDRRPRAAGNITQVIREVKEFRKKSFAQLPYLNSAFTRPTDAGATTGSFSLSTRTRSIKFAFGPSNGAH
jgi:hypothetical protein